MSGCRLPDSLSEPLGLCLGDRKSEDVSGGGSSALSARFHNGLWTVDSLEAEREDVSGGGSSALSARFHNELWTADCGEVECEDVSGGGSPSCGRWTPWRRNVRMSRAVAVREADRDAVSLYSTRLGATNDEDVSGAGVLVGAKGGGCLATLLCSTRLQPKFNNYCD